MESIGICSIFQPAFRGPGTNKTNRTAWWETTAVTAGKKPINFCVFKKIVFKFSDMRLLKNIQEQIEFLTSSSTVQFIYLKESCEQKWIKQWRILIFTDSEDVNLEIYEYITTNTSSDKVIMSHHQSLRKKNVFYTYVLLIFTKTELLPSFKEDF